MDITLLFRACVKTVRTTNKSLGINNEKPTNVLKSTRRDIHLTKAKEIIKEVSNLQQFLLEHKFAYLNVVNYLSTNKTMTESDREQIDSKAEEIINNCSGLIIECKKTWLRDAKTQQLHEHYRNVLESVEVYLKTVSKMYTETKAIRVKKVIETHKLSKLENVNKNKSMEVKEINKNSKENQTKNSLNSSSTNSSIIIPQSNTKTENVEEELSPEELQMFESENEHLYNELNSLSDEVKNMESKVVRIAELQELFTEKVLEQDKEIELISARTAGSTEDMKVANDQIRQAIQRNAGLRVWVLFFLLVMSFSLLFLDWYND
nr:syntaxin-18 [Onthophagus taurus]